MIAPVPMKWPRRITRTTRTPAFSETPCHPMITHTSDSHQIPSQNKTKSKLQIWKKLQEPLHADMGCRTDQRTDGRMDEGTDGVKPIWYPPTTSLCWGYKNQSVPNHNTTKHNKAQHSTDLVHNSWDILSISSSEPCLPISTTSFIGRAPDISPWW